MPSLTPEQARAEGEALRARTKAKGTSVGSLPGQKAPPPSSRPTVMGKTGSVAVPKITTAGSGSLPGSPAPGPLAPAMPDLTVTAAPSPEMQASIEAWKKRMAELEAKAGSTDPNLQWQIEQYKQRMSTDPTQRAIEKAAGAIRSQAGGMGGAMDVAGAQMGRGEGFGAAGIGDAAQAALARSASDIALGREGQLDKLLLGGQATMAAPGQQQMVYQGMLGQMYGQNPYAETAKMGLSQQQLALQAYLGQLEAQARMAEAQARAYGSPLDWYSMLLGQV